MKVREGDFVDLVSANRISISLIFNKQTVFKIVFAVSKVLNA